MAVQISGNDITVPRDGSFTRNVTIGGTLTYEDVTNIDSVGLVTARTGIEIGARPGVAASISVDGNMIVSGISTFGGAANFAAISGTTGTFTGDVDIADKIVHSGDTNTAIRFPAADTVTAETAGSERLRITSGGLVGVGQATPTHMLHVDSSSASDSTATAFFKGRIIRFDGAAASHSPRLNLSLDGTDKVSILCNRTDSSLNIETLTSAPIIFDTNSNERLRITSNGLKVGTTVDNNYAVIHAHSSGTSARLHLTSANTGTTTSDGAIIMLDSDSNMEILNKENTNLEFFTNNTERLRIKSTGHVSVVDGNLEFAAGHGVDFSANPNASGVASNLFDDYEEGQFTPSFSGGLVFSSYANNGQRGMYTRIGRFVYATIRLDGSTMSTQNTNQILISGLPFTALGAQNGFQIGGADPFYQDGFYNSNDFSGIVGEGTSNISLVRRSDGAALTGTSVNGGRQIRMNVWYMAA